MLADITMEIRKALFYEFKKEKENRVLILEDVKKRMNDLNDLKNEEQIKFKSLQEKVRKVKEV